MLPDRHWLFRPQTLVSFIREYVHRITAANRFLASKPVGQRKQVSVSLLKLLAQLPFETDEIGKFRREDIVGIDMKPRL